MFNTNQINPSRVLVLLLASDRISLALDRSRDKTEQNAAESKCAVAHNIWSAKIKGPAGPKGPACLYKKRSGLRFCIQF